MSRRPNARTNASGSWGAPTAGPTQKKSGEEVGNQIDQLHDDPCIYNVCTQMFFKPLNKNQHTFWESKKHSTELWNCLSFFRNPNISRIFVRKIWSLQKFSGRNSCRKKRFRYINRSLFELANCILALCDGNRDHVPFRSQWFAFSSIKGILATPPPQSEATP